MFIAFNELGKKEVAPSLERIWEPLQNLPESSSKHLAIVQLWRPSLSPPSLCTRPLLLQLPLPGMFFLQLLLFSIPVSALSPPLQKSLPFLNQSSPNSAISSTLALLYYCPYTLSLAEMILFDIFVYCLQIQVSWWWRQPLACTMLFVCLVILKYVRSVSQRSLGVW